jgi:hypothetical protein
MDSLVHQSAIQAYITVLSIIVICCVQKLIDKQQSKVPSPRICKERHPSQHRHTGGTRAVRGLQERGVKDNQLKLQVEL